MERSEGSGKACGERLLSESGGGAAPLEPLMGKGEVRQGVSDIQN